jgi:hypothetical protein
MRGGWNVTVSVRGGKNRRKPVNSGGLKMAVPDKLTLDREDLIILGAIIIAAKEPNVRKSVMVMLAKHGFSLKDIAALREETLFEAKVLRKANRETGTMEH